MTLSQYILDRLLLSNLIFEKGIRRLLARIGAVYKANYILNYAKGTHVAQMDRPQHKIHIQVEETSFCICRTSGNHNLPTYADPGSSLKWVCGTSGIQTSRKYASAIDKAAFSPNIHTGHDLATNRNIGTFTEIPSIR